MICSRHIIYLYVFNTQHFLENRVFFFKIILHVFFRLEKKFIPLSTIDSQYSTLLTQCCTHVILIPCRDLPYFITIVRLIYLQLSIKIIDQRLF